MSSAPIPSLHSGPLSGVIPFPRSFETSQAQIANQPKHRPGSREQGQALEALGHAIEYLIDSRVLRHGSSSAKADADAVKILVRLNQWVYADCPEVIPASKQLRVWLAKWVSRSSF